MRRLQRLILPGLFALVLAACDSPESVITEKKQEQPSATQLPGETEPSAIDPGQDAPEATVQAFKTIEWTDLMPADDLEAILNPPEYINDIEDGSFEDQISSQIENSIAAASDDRYQQALTSTRVNAEMDGMAIRIPGFVVPLEFNDQKAVTEFFFVPYFGACIHVPPPPPNQILFVSYPQGLEQNNLYDPYWISGIVSTTLVDNDIATSAYSMQMHAYEMYTE